MFSLNHVPMKRSEAAGISGKYLTNWIYLPSVELIADMLNVMYDVLTCPFGMLPGNFKRYIYNVKYFIWPYAHTS